MKLAFGRRCHAFVVAPLCVLATAGICQSTSSLGFPALAVLSAPQGPLSMTGILILGSGATALDATATLAIDPLGMSTITINSGGDKQSETFLFRSGRPRCTNSTSKYYSSPVDSGICGSPVPWFCPSLFLGKLSANTFSVTASGSGGATVFTLTRRRIAPGSERDPENTWLPSFTFTAAGLLNSYSYRIPAIAGSPQYSEAVIDYSDYRQTAWGQMPFHIHQSLDGTASIDLTITSIVEGAR
jgi:hypothetical protein